MPALCNTTASYFYLKGARAQHYLDLFPNGARAGEFRRIRDHIGDEIRFREW